MEEGHFLIRRSINVCCVCLSSDIGTVHCSVVSIPVIFGKDVTLICKTADEKDLCTLCRKIWTGGPELSLLSLNGFPTDDSKYWPTIRKNGFEITIRNFTKKDLNQKYICTIGESACSRNLTIDMFKILEEDATEDNTLTFNTLRSISPTALVTIIVIFVIFAIGVFIMSLRTSIIRKAIKTVGCVDFIYIEKQLNTQNLGTNEFGRLSNSQNSKTAVDEKENKTIKVCTRNEDTDCEKEECLSERQLNCEE
ncbi:unnamed protein product [Mytilus coruscus]|uniref:Uncharacterized protein n=1 Tax=Mytilus coruscus TaxID=42192 RepID=A0A6J8BSS5_MYTCO|nr:unnamed protein product [Mytilus coruscus]